MSQTRSASLKEVALLFLKLGTTAFGGPAAHTAMMEHEVVRQRNWLSREEFLDLMGATHLIPGPNSTELAIHIGHRKAGWAGLLVAGACFILPAVFIVSACAWAYVHYGTLPAANNILYGVKPVIIAVVLQALWGLGKSAIKNRTLAVVALLAAVINILETHEVLVILLSGVLNLVLSTRDSKANPTSHKAGFASATLFWFFLKVGSVLFGSGYVLLAFLRSDLVERLGWLTESQLLDATAVGQFTPGPVFTTATFIGYVLSGPMGAMLATVGIFLPAFFFVAISAPFLPKLRESKSISFFLDGVNVASLALMALVTWHLGRVTVIDLLTLALAVTSAFVLIRFRVNSVWLVLFGAIVGFWLG